MIMIQKLSAVDLGKNNKYSETINTFIYTFKYIFNKKNCQA